MSCASLHGKLATWHLKCVLYMTLHYIRPTLEAIYSGLSKNNFKDHYGDAEFVMRDEV